MAKVIEDKNKKGNYYFRCPGCKRLHFIATITPLPNGAKWTFNGNMDSPTFSPSIRESLLESINPRKEVEVCHFFVINGQIQFCGDSFHELRGTTINLPEFTEL